MAIYPGAYAVKLITTDPGRYHTPIRLTLHTAVSGAIDLYKGRAAPNGTYAHFYVNEHGHVYQYRDTAQAARADLEGNYGTISVETWDGGRERPWTPAQMSALARLFDWATRAHATIPRRMASPTDTRGLAWHRLGCSGNFGPFNLDDLTTWSRAQTGAVWSNARGKTCPYDTRIRQIPDIYRRATTTTTTAATTATTPTPPQLGDNPMFMIWKRQNDGKALYAVCSPGMFLVFTGQSAANNLIRQIAARDVTALEVSEAFWEHIERACMTGTNQPDVTARYEKGE